MPVYEYHCEHCNGVFEQLLPVRRASEAQPCPQCDADSRRLMPTTVNSFVVRDGIPRRIPDTGKFWHHEQIVDRPVNTTVELGEHPDLYRQKFGPDHAPTVEEEEKFADEMLKRIEREIETVESGGLPVADTVVERETQAFMDRKRRTAAEARAKTVRDPNSRVTARTRSGKHVPTKREMKEGGAVD